MRNPYEALGKPKPSMIEFDEWGGVFACQEQGCYEAATIAKYIKKERILTWQCPDGHLSKMEDVDE